MTKSESESVIILFPSHMSNSLFDPLNFKANRLFDGKRTTAQETPQPHQHQPHQTSGNRATSRKTRLPHIGYFPHIGRKPAAKCFFGLCKIALLLYGLRPQTTAPCPETRAQTTSPLSLITKLPLLA